MWIVMRMIPWSSLRLQTNLPLGIHPLSGEAPHGSQSFLPVFDDEAKAIEASDGGKYPMFEVTTKALTVEAK